MKRNLLLLISGILLTAVTGAAQVILNQTTSGLTTVRQEGKKERIGTVTLTVQTGGFCPGANCFIPAGVTILITFNTTIANAATVGLGNVACSPTVPPAIPTGDLCPPGLAVAASGAVVSLHYPALTNTPVAPGDEITVGISAVGPPAVPAPLRVNATTLTGGSFVTADPNSINPSLTFGVTNRNVALVAPTLALTVGLSPSTFWFPPLPGPFAIITCNPPSLGPPTISFVVNVKENFPNALTSITDEGTGATNGSNIEVTISNVPPNVTLEPTFPIYCPNTSAATCMLTLDPAGFGSGAAVTNMSASQAPLTFDFTPLTTNVGAIEDVDIEFNVVTSSATLPTSEMSPGVATFSLVPTASTATPQFNGVPEPYNSLGGNVITISDCVTDFLFPWVSNFNGTMAVSNNHFDTTIIIDNTTKDPFGGLVNGGAAPFSLGNCTVTMFPTDGTTPGTFMSSPVPAGAELFFNVSDPRFTPPMAGKSGYIIASCTFQNGHGYVNIYDNVGIGPPVVAQTYLGLILPNPAVVHRNPAGGPGAPGEGLVH